MSAQSNPLSRPCPAICRKAVSLAGVLALGMTVSLVGQVAAQQSSLTPVPGAAGSAKASKPFGEAENARRDVDPTSSEAISRQLEELRDNPVEKLRGNGSASDVVDVPAMAGDRRAADSAERPRPVVSFDELQEIEHQIGQNEIGRGEAGQEEAGQEEAGQEEAGLKDAEGVSRIEAQAIAPDPEAEARLKRAQGDAEWTDPVIDEAARSAFDTDFIQRQSEFSQSLILLDRQTRLGKAIGQIIEIYGPDAMIEIAPGEFQSFAHLPAARKLRAELDAANLEMEARRLEMENERREAELEFERRQAEFEREQAALAAQDKEDVTPSYTAFSVREIFGLSGNLRAVLVPLGTGERIRVAAGDTLRAGSKVIAIEAGAVTLEHRGGERERLSLND